MFAGGSINHGHFISNSSIAGKTIGCQHRFNYVLNHQASFPMCLGHNQADLKHGMSIINLITSRGYLPTCRIMQLMQWMHAEVSYNGRIPRDSYFIDIGANIGSCSVHMAGLGFPVISVEPVVEHVNTILGSIAINPAFHLEVFHLGISGVEKTLKVNFGHGARNWGASAFFEANQNDTCALELQVKTLDQVIGHRKVGLLKVDCEGCEWEALKG